MRLPDRLTTFLRCVAAGACIALAVPPAGWWPLAFVGLALWDRSLAGASRTQRFRRSWLIAAVWFFPTMFWMVDLTPPGYVVACVLYAAYFAVAGAATPPGRARWIVLPGTIVLAELAKWTFPFGGVPLANLALTQAGSCAPPCTQLDSPVAQASRLLGPLLVVALVVVGGIALSAAWERAWRAAAIALATVVVVTGLGVVAPRGADIGPPLRVAIVQGGGEQRTRAATTDSRKVFERHVQATRDLVSTPVDLIVWPENVVAVEGRLEDNDEFEELQELAREKDATLVVGITEGISDDEFLNASVVFTPDGELVDRYDKVRAVPFGEFVPLRGLIERVAGGSGIPGRDVVPGTEPAVVDTPVGRLGVVISWEVFFANRARDAIGNGGELLLNPTNGSSYWLTQVQTQQVASSRLRAIETGRWELQAAPTGFSALVDPAGALLERTDVSEQAVIEAEVHRREGQTLATTVGSWPAIVLSVVAIAVGWTRQRRSDRGDPGTRDPQDQGTGDAPLAAEPVA
jgi:apolipoprotein N-acyltransferase